MRRLYSYIRFSTPEQAAGSSTARQTEFAERYAAEHGLTLDAGLSLRDEGLSAYHQHHVKQGALGAFLRAIENGQVESGSILIIEALDRLSRAEPIEAQALLYQIINAGITVVTASDGKHYDRASLKYNPMDLVYSLLVMIRAHEESDTKSRRVNAAIRIACEDWISGKKRTHIRNGRAPEWLIESGNTEPPLYAVIPERAAALKEAIRLYNEGFGGAAIAKELNAQGLSYTGRPIGAAHFYKVIKSKALRGIKSIAVNGEEYDLQDYYPAIISQQEHDKLRSARTQRPRASNGNIPGIFTGINVAYCGYCGSSMNGINMVSRARSDGTIADGHRRLLCAAHSLRQDCPIGSSVSLPIVERALLTYCQDEMSLQELTEQSDSTIAMQKKLATVETELEIITRKTEKLTSALLETDEPPITIMRTMRNLEQRQSELDAERKLIGSEIRTILKRDNNKLLDDWQQIITDVDQLDYSARTKARSLCSKTFSRIDVFIKGLSANETGAQAQVAALLDSRLPKKAPSKKPDIDLVLRFKSGAVRLLRINPTSGKWTAQADF